MKKNKVTSRQCALKKEVKPTNELIRFVLSPDDEIVPDIDAKADGRGVWLTLSKSVIKEAMKKNIFASSLKQKVKFSDELAQLVCLRLEQRLLGSLGLARKAGQLLLGGAKVRSSIEKKEITALLIANDGALDGRNKIVGMAKARLEPTSFLQIDFFNSEQLSLALGRENVIYGALINGAAANSAVERAKRLVQYHKENEK